jgi:hypothetical protein
MWERRKGIRGWGVHCASVQSTLIYGGMTPYSSKLRTLACKRQRLRPLELQVVCTLCHDLFPWTEDLRCAALFYTAERENEKVER